MALPKQVEQQLREVEELERQMSAQGNPPDTPTEPSEPPETPPADVPKPDQPPADPKKTDDWEHKYRSLEGKYNAEVPRLHAQVKELSAQVTELMQKAAPQTKETPPEPHESLVTDKDEEAFGADLIDVQRRVAREVMREYVTPLRDELKQRDEKIAALEKALTKTGGDVATMSFEQKLAMAVPDFVALNHDPKWIAWLDEKDPYTNEPRRIYAEFVYSNGDVEKVKSIVDYYKATALPPNPDAERQRRQSELERQVSPSRSNASSALPPSERIYTEAEVNKLFNKVRDLNVAGKSEEANKLEAELSLAYMQGRVRG